ncbi:MAG: sigma-54-dependent Fis family transcriptional regulator [Deltaproteobacteria bacterium]|nr:MAG: sigma-54-dependent Fis family transcriptional regulator [Deltaproteobacteria bacterium]
MRKILLIEHNPKLQNYVKKAIEPTYQLTYCPHGKDIYSRLRDENYQIILLSFQIEKPDDFGLLRRIKLLSPQTPVVVLSEIDEASLIVKSIKEGAFDFIVKPFTKEKILMSIERALENRHLKNEIDYLRHEQDIIYNFDAIIASSPAMKRTIATLKKFSQAESTILLTGETGTGKSFLSGAVHFNSRRRKRPFIKINCANIPEALLESELFGHEKGAFTGANKLRVGRLEQGNGGTVFLDEIGEMTQGLQAKLLRVLEEKSFERVGGNRTIHSDVRIICATNRHPEQQVKEGNFREDLYYRINILRVHLPPLRERRECIEILAHFLMEKSCRNLKKKIKGFSLETLEAFKNYTWPGNIRQLANIIERAVILEESPFIQLENTTLQEPPHAKPKHEPLPSHPVHSIRDQEKEIIIKALEESLWVQKEAAKLLDITPRTLNYKIKKFGISHPRWRKNI